MNDTAKDTREQTLILPREAAQLKQLSKLATSIKHEVRLMEDRLRRSVKHALTAGKLLCEAKKAVGYKNWLNWFHTQDFDFSEVTAQRYMRLARRWSELQDKIAEAGDPSRLTDLTFSDALQLLSNPDRIFNRKDSGSKTPACLPGKDNERHSGDVPDDGDNGGGEKVESSDSQQAALAAELAELQQSIQTFELSELNSSAIAELRETTKRLLDVLGQLEQTTSTETS
ncbi:MAG: DUF3102 domain-containing protein [Planctomycetales bacterium]|nr:DUF3102 domain-containing protein [Planctomycetales bacterium]